MTQFQTFWQRLRQHWWRHQAQMVVAKHQEDLRTVYHAYTTPRPYPTAQEWDQFRRARDAAFAQHERDPMGFVPYPILGSMHYHWTGLGEEPTAIEHGWWDGGLWIALQDGRRIFVPPDVVPILRDALPEERNRMVIRHGNDVGHEYIEFPLLNMEVMLISVLSFRLGVHDTSTFIHQVSTVDPMTQIVDLIRDVIAGDATRMDGVLREIHHRIHSGG